MRGTLILATMGVLVASAGVAVAHDFHTDDPATGGGNHQCSGVKNWIGTPGQTIISQGIKVPNPDPEAGGEEMDVRVYIHMPPHGAPPNQDAGSPLPAGAPVRGVLWLETNGLNGFQKGDFICVGTNPDDPEYHDDPEGHGDMVIL